MKPRCGINPISHGWLSDKYYILSKAISAKIRPSHGILDMGIYSMATIQSECDKFPSDRIIKLFEGTSLTIQVLLEDYLSDPQNNIIEKFTFLTHSTPKDMSIKIVLGISISILTVIGMVGNFGTILILSLTRRLRRKPFIYFLNLAVADLVSLCLGLPLLLVESVFGSIWPLDNSICKATIYSIFVCLYETGFTLQVIAWDRLYAVRHPIRYQLSRNNKWILLSMITTWTLSLTLNIPLLISYISIPFNSRNITMQVCVESWPSEWSRRAYWLMTSLIGFITTMLIVIICFAVSRLLFARTSAGLGNNYEQMTRKSWKATKMLIIVAFMVFASVTPYLIMKLLDVFETAKAPRYAEVFGVILGYLSSVWNPIIYTFRSKEIKDVLRQIFRRCGSLHWNTPLRSQSTRTVHPIN